MRGKSRVEPAFSVLQNPLGFTIDVSYGAFADEQLRKHAAYDMSIANNIIIRLFASGDEAEVSRLIIDNLILVNVIDYGEAAVNQLAVFYAPEWMLRYARTCETYVAVVGPEIVGTIALDQERVRSLFIRVDYHRQGIGKRLMRFIEEAARQQDMKQLNLLANVGAVEFYRKLGFVLREKREIEVGEARILVAYMEKALLRE